MNCATLSTSCAWVLLVLLLAYSVPLSPLPTQPVPQPSSSPHIFHSLYSALCKIVFFYLSFQHTSSFKPDLIGNSVFSTHHFFIPVNRILQQSIMVRYTGNPCHWFNYSQEYYTCKQNEQQNSSSFCWWIFSGAYRFSPHAVETRNWHRYLDILQPSYHQHFISFTAWSYSNPGTLANTTKY